MFHFTKALKTSLSKSVRIMLAVLSVVVFFTAAQVANAATYTVTNTLDSGAGSLRQAVIDANATVGERGQGQSESGLRGRHGDGRHLAVPSRS